MTEHCESTIIKFKKINYCSQFALGPITSLKFFNVDLISMAVYLFCFWFHIMLKQIPLCFVSSFFPPFLLRCSWQTALCKFRLYNIVIYIYHEMIIPISSVHIHHLIQIPNTKKKRKKKGVFSVRWERLGFSLLITFICNIQQN